MDVDDFIKGQNKRATFSIWAADSAHEKMAVKTQSRDRKLSTLDDARGKQKKHDVCGCTDNNITFELSCC